MVRVAITGAGGFLGSAAVSHFSLHPDIQEIRALYSRLPDVSKVSRKVTSFIGDLRDHAVVDSLVDGVDVVLHLASRGYPLDTVDDPVQLIVDNLCATGALLAAMVKKGTKRIVYASSGGALYANDRESSPITEEAATAGRSAYAITKLAIEDILRLPAYSPWLKPCILRISNPYGAGLMRRERQGFVGIALKKLLAGETLDIWGSDQIRKDFIYIDDVMTAFEKVMLFPDAGCDVYHVSTGVPTSLREVIAAMEEICGRKLSTRVLAPRAADSPWTALSSEKFSLAYDWRPHYDIKAGMTAMIARMHEQD